MTQRSKALLQRVGEAYLEQLDALIAAADRGGAKQFGLLLVSASDTATTMTESRALRASTLSEHLRSREQWRQQELAKAIVGNDDAACLRRQLVQQIASIRADIEQRDAPHRVASRWGVVAFIDYLRANIIDLLLLADSFREKPQRAAQFEGPRSLAAVMAERFPGQTIEVRVPPVTAVQVGIRGEGPAHTRGTPPNVVETDPTSWWQLATGAIDWATARDQGRVQVSGAHADQTAQMLPIYRPYWSLNAG